MVCADFFHIQEFSGCIGYPMPSTECKIVGDDGQTLTFEEPGELCVRGPQVMQAYWQRPKETASVLDDDGWLHIGDIAIVRDDGTFKIVRRKKDLILVSGFNVYPNEIEDVVVSHPGVAEAAAIGIDEEKTAETEKIVVVRKDPIFQLPHS